MALQDADLERIGRYVQSQLPGWLDAADRPLPGVQIVERLTRLEDAILSGQELMRSEFRAQRDLMDRRFESMDKRFDDMQVNFARTRWLIGVWFVVLGSLVSV